MHTDKVECSLKNEGVCIMTIMNAGVYKYFDGVSERLVGYIYTKGQFQRIGSFGCNLDTDKYFVAKVVDCTIFHDSTISAAEKVVLYLFGEPAAADVAIYKQRLETGFLINRYLGIEKNLVDNTWKCTYRVADKVRMFGNFKTAEEAALAYDINILFDNKIFPKVFNFGDPTSRLSNIAAELMDFKQAISAADAAKDQEKLYGARRALGYYLKATVLQIWQQALKDPAPIAKLLSTSDPIIVRPSTVQEVLDAGLQKALERDAISERQSNQINNSTYTSSNVRSSDSPDSTTTLSSEELDWLEGIFRNIEEDEPPKKRHKHG